METMETPSSEEVRKLQAATEAERDKLRSELNQAIADANAEIATAEIRKTDQQKSASECKLLRLEKVQQSGQIGEELAEVEKDFEISTERVAELQANHDASTKKDKRRLQIAWPKEDDADLRDERRILRTLRVPDRVRQLHDALMAALRQESLSNASFDDHERSLQEVQAKADELRRLEGKTKRELSERQFSQPEAGTPRKEKARRVDDAGAPLASALSRGGLDRSRGSDSSKRVEVEDFTMAARAKTPAGFDDDDENLLFGASKPGGFGAGSKFGGLLGQNALGAGSGPIGGRGSKFGGVLGQNALGAGSGAMAGGGGVLGARNFHAPVVKKTNTMKSIFNM